MALRASTTHKCIFLKACFFFSPTADLFAVKSTHTKTRTILRIRQIQKTIWNTKFWHTLYLGSKYLSVHTGSTLKWNLKIVLAKEPVSASHIQLGHSLHWKLVVLNNSGKQQRGMRKTKETKRTILNFSPAVMQSHLWSAFISVPMDFPCPPPCTFSYSLFETLQSFTR